MSWFFAAVKKYAVFEGRARRKEFWYFVLFYIIFSLVLGIVDALAGTQVPTIGIGLISIIYGIAMLVPSVSVSVRRLHDTGRSGWWWVDQLAASHWPRLSSWSSSCWIASREITGTVPNPRRRQPNSPRHKSRCMGRKTASPKTADQPTMHPGHLRCSPVSVRRGTCAAGCQA